MMCKIEARTANVAGCAVQRATLIGAGILGLASF